ncbi:MAG: hypothetical protein LBC98_01720 [Prevotellaceae bacterium]|jgi:V/A-type H+-transporting ATPase subunit E|nr:hypothetical protein [Prevotellaceae bacterium]
MKNKLKELTDKLYNEGLSKGQQDADEIVGKAKSEAENILQKAAEEAESIIKAAEKQAAEISANADAEIKLAGRQVVSEIKQRVKTVIVAGVVAPAISAAFDDKAFVQSLIKTAAEKFTLDGELSGLSMLVPENMQKELVDYAEKQILAKLSKGLEIKADKQIKAGFKIGAKDGGYYIGFTNEDFNNLLSDYLRPKIAALLFG